MFSACDANKSCLIDMFSSYQGILQVRSGIRTVFIIRGFRVSVQYSQAAGLRTLRLG